LARTPVSATQQEVQLARLRDAAALDPRPGPPATESHAESWRALQHPEPVGHMLRRSTTYLPEKLTRIKAPSTFSC
jgi:hypothetical protein